MSHDSGFTGSCCFLSGPSKIGSPIAKQRQRHPLALFRKILVSENFLSAILGPEMAAPILWAPRISVFFLQENLHVHKIPRFRGGGILGLGGGVSILGLGGG